MDADIEARANALIAQSDGKIWIESGDRDTETQTRLWNEAVAKYGEEEARNWVAPPGHSNHEKGIAIDFGGDMELLAQLAPQFGIYQPMSWEPWHYEPVGSRDQSDPNAYTIQPRDPSSLVSATRVRTYGDVMSNLLGIRPFQSPTSTADISLQRGGMDPLITSNPGFLDSLIPSMDLLAPGPTIRVPGTGVKPPSSPGSGFISTGTDIDKFLAAIRTTESSGNYIAVGPATRWGTAKGAYQYLDSTWDNYGGYATADLAPPEVQDQRAREDFQRYYDKYGSWDTVAAIHYSGEGGNWESDEVQEYVGKVRSNL